MSRLQSVFKNKAFMVFTSINLLFLIINILTLTWTTLPCDNVSLVDAPANFALEGKWYTTAVFGDRYGNVFTGYPPLYEFLLIPLIWCFGLSFATCRMLSVGLTFVISFFAFKPVRELNKSTFLPLIILSLLLWCGDIFSFTYRNEHPSILIMCCSVGFLFNYFKANNKWFMFLWAFLAFIAGFQCLPYLFGLLLCLFMFKTERHKLKTAFLMLITGCFTGMLFICMFFYAQGCLLSFLHRTFMFSNTFKSIFSAIYTYIEPYLVHLIPDNINVRDSLVLMTRSSSVSLWDKIITGYSNNPQYIILSLINIIIVLYLLMKGQLTRKSPELKVLCITLITPMFMILIGWYPSYYTWMGYITAVLLAVYITAKYGKQKIVSAVYVIATIFTVFTGLPITLIQADRDAYSNVCNFVKRHNFDSDSKIVAPFMSYYTVRNITKNCYFAGLYPLSQIPENIEYVMWAENDHGDCNILKYLEQCKHNGKTVNPIDSIESHLK